MTEREKVAKAIAVLCEVLKEVDSSEKCNPCIAIMVNRAHILIGNIKTDYERFLD